MISELYRGVNFVAYLLLGVVICALQSVLLKIPVLAWLESDLLLLVVVYLSLHRKPVEGAILTVILARMAEAHSGSPAGILIACYLGVYVSILFTKEMFLVGTSFSAIVLTITAGAVWKIIFLILAEHFGYIANIWRSSLEYAIPFLLGLGLLSRPVFELLRRIDVLTSYERESEARQMSGEDF